MLNTKFKKCKFIAGATNTKHIPKSLYVNEVAFAGRANVGKSSLLNALTLQKGLAHTSKTPGRTQQINFFSIEDFITLVDLPGYGYSKVSKSLINKWSKLIAFYISSRENLKQVFLLIDSRRGIQENDMAVIKWLEMYGISYRLILTKTDKVSSTELQELSDNINNTLSALPHANTELIITSTKKNIGIEKLRYIVSTYS